MSDNAAREDQGRGQDPEQERAGPLAEGETAARLGQRGSDD